MSVQVKRRREAAAFLAGYVGAQGELLIDTTNNRVQVHDGTTSGGWPAAAIGDLPGRNVVINGTFSINQRLYASASSSAAGAYAHDRWKAGSGGCTYSFTQTVPDTTITISAGSLVQAVEAPNVYATAFWLTWLGTAQARVWQGSATGTYSSGAATIVGGITVNALLVTSLALGVIANLDFGPGTLGLVQFEAALPNAGPTRFERRLPSLELLLCQRYYQIINLMGSQGQVGTATGVFIGYTFPVAMRASPSGTLLISSLAANAYQIAVNGSFVSASGMTMSAGFSQTAAFFTIFGFSNLPQGTAVLGTAALSFIALSAEL